MSNAPSTTPASHTVHIPAHRMEQLEAVIAKLAKKAAKLSCKAPVATVVKTYTVDVSEDKKYPRLVEWNEVRIDYEVIAVAGAWRFIAKVETQDEVNGEPRNKVSGVNLSDEHARKLITTPMVCEHCGINRKRNACFVVQDANDHLTMVGSSCLTDYLGLDPAQAVAGLEFDATIRLVGQDDDEWGYNGSSAPCVVSLDQFAAATIAIVASQGFVKAADAQFGNRTKTGDDVMTFCLDDNPALSDWKARVNPEEDHVGMAGKVLEKLNNRILPAYRNDPTALDQFAFKVGICLNKGYVGKNDAQLMAAAINIECGKIANNNVKSAVKNEWLPGASEGTKIAVKATVAFVKEISTQFGVSMLVKFITLDGFPMTTFYSGKNNEFTVGSVVNVKGTVKKLEDGRFGKQTTLTRVKVAP